MNNETLADLIAAHTDSTRSNVEAFIPDASGFIHAVARAIEAEHTCTCTTTTGFPPSGLGVGVHYVNCPAGNDNEFDSEEWVATARGTVDNMKQPH